MINIKKRSIWKLIHYVGKKNENFFIKLKEIKNCWKLSRLKNANINISINVKII